MKWHNLCRHLSNGERGKKTKSPHSPYMRILEFWLARIWDERSEGIIHTGHLVVDILVPDNGKCRVVEYS